MSRTLVTCGFQNADSSVLDTLVELLLNLDSLQSMAVRNVSIVRSLLSSTALLSQY
jgi:hypothetical protein